MQVKLLGHRLRYFLLWRLAGIEIRQVKISTIANVELKQLGWFSVNHGGLSELASQDDQKTVKTKQGVT